MDQPTNGGAVTSRPVRFQLDHLAQLDRAGLRLARLCRRRLRDNTRELTKWKALSPLDVQCFYPILSLKPATSRTRLSWLTLSKRDRPMSEGQAHSKSCEPLRYESTDVEQVRRD
jgi:hypothetical protein